MQSTQEKILIAATECFFQHGYTAANVSMIARYAEISRVTIHKQFKSKEALFRAVVEKHINENNVLLEKYTQSIGDFWAETEAFTLGRCGELFEEISSAIVRADLLYAGQNYCQDIIQENEVRARASISLRLTKELADKRLSLNKTGMSVQALAQAIEVAPLGIALSSLEEDNTAYIKNLMKLFKASTAI